jgi:hypothetical protein
MFKEERAPLKRMGSSQEKALGMRAIVRVLQEV